MAKLGLCVSVLLWLAAGSIGARGIGGGDAPLNECREAGRVCAQEARTGVRVCMDGCEDGEAGDACRTECRSLFQDDRASCRAETRECLQANLPPLDELCVEDCRAQFADTREDLRACRGDCKADLRAAIAACREDLANDSDALRTCIGEAHKETRLCSQDCHDEYACASELRECLGACVIE